MHCALVRSPIILCGVFDANINENDTNNRLDILQNTITSPARATSWPVCEKLTRVRSRFVFTRVLVFGRVNKVGSNPG